MKKIVFTSLAAFLFSCSQQEQQTVKEEPKDVKKPLNIILLVGDGMGLSQLSSVYYFGEKEPSFSRFKTIGLSQTSAATHKITDSAAGATAFSTGKKTYNGAIAVDTDTNAIETIVEDVSQRGWNTGVVSTSTITHATPASFYAHVKSRGEQPEIATQLVRSDIDFFAGGGSRYFANRLDSINWLDSLTAYGFHWDTTDVLPPINDYTKKYGFLAAYDGLTPKHQGRGDFLLQATDRALDYLSHQDSSFFLMIEGSQIDWGGHANNADYVVQETLEYDLVIDKVLDFAEAHGNTLVIVTADHETGGFTLASYNKPMPYRQTFRDYDSIVPSFSTGGHSAALIPVFAYGPGEANFSGVYQNTHLHELMLKMVTEKQ